MLQNSTAIHRANLVCSMWLNYFAWMQTDHRIMENDTGTHTLYNVDSILPAVVVVGLFSALILHTSDDDDAHRYLQWSIMFYFVDLVLVDLSKIHDAFWAQKVLTAEAFEAFTADHIKFSMKALSFCTYQFAESWILFQIR